MNHDVFISYKSEDKEQAAWVRENLEANGISCWMAPESIPGGSNYAMEIVGAMSRCHCVVVVMTAKTLTSMWVDKEIELALNMQKTVLPFMLEQVALVGSYQLYLSNVQQYAAYKNPNEALKELIRDVRKVKGDRGATPKIVTRRPAQANGLGVTGVLSLILGLAIAVLLLWLVVREVGSPLLGIAPANGTTTTTTTTIGLIDGTTTTESANPTDGTTTATTTAPSSAETTAATTTSATAQPTTPQVIGEAALDAVPDYSRLATNQPNLSRKTAAEVPMNGMIGGVLKADQDYWYGFCTSPEMNVYRVAGLRVNGADTLFDLYVTLYDEAGLKQQEIYIARNQAYGFQDFVLAPNKQYYVKVSSRNVAERSAVGYGLFVSPRSSDTGVSKEDATKVELNKEYIFELNSTLDDWFVFRADAPGHDTYRVTLYNIDVNGAIELIGTRSTGGTLCSLSVAGEDSGESGLYASEGWTVYFQVGAKSGVDEPNGTYMLVVTTYY